MSGGVTLLGGLGLGLQPSHMTCVVSCCARRTSGTALSWRTSHCRPRTQRPSVHPTERPACRWLTGRCGGGAEEADAGAPVPIDVGVKGLIPPPPPGRLQYPALVPVSVHGTCIWDPPYTPHGHICLLVQRWHRQGTGPSTTKGPGPDPMQAPHPPPPPGPPWPGWCHLAEALRPPLPPTEKAGVM